MSEENSVVRPHVEEGLSMYSLVRTHDNIFCGICFRAVPKGIEFQTVEMPIVGDIQTYRTNVNFVCMGCVARSVSLADTDEMFCGVTRAAE